MTRPWRRGLRALVTVLLTVALVAWVVRRVDAAEVWRLIVDGRRGLWGLAVCLGPVQIALSAARWRRCSAVLGQALTRRRALGEVGLSTLLNQLLPGGVAGDAIRAWRARTEAAGLIAALRAVVVDRLVGLGVHLVVTAVGLVLWALWGPAVPGGMAGAVAVLGVLGAVAVLAPGRGSADLRRVLLADGPAQLGLSALLTASFLGGFALCGAALGQELGLWVLSAVPLVLLAMAVPVSVGGWGLREASAALLLPRFGFSEEAAVALSAGYGLTVLLGALPGALAWTGGRR